MQDESADDCPKAPERMSYELDLDDETADRIESHRTRMMWDLKRKIPDEHVARDLLDKADRYKRLKGSLRRGDEHVRRADNGNVVIDDGDNLVVIRPEDAAALASALNHAAHGGEQE